MWFAHTNWFKCPFTAFSRRPTRPHQDLMWPDHRRLQMLLLLICCDLPSLAHIQLCGLWPRGREAPIHPTAPAHPRILAPHGTLPHLLFICFITPNSCLPSDCSPDAVTLGWALCCSSTEWELKKVERETHHPNLMSCISSGSAKWIEAVNWSWELQ